MKKRILNDLLSVYNIKEIEKHLFYSFITKNKLSIESSPILFEYFKFFIENKELNTKINELNINSLKDLENHLELIIPIDDRKLNGAFFTPNFIIDFIIQELQPLEKHLNLDPSCGCGAFLMSLTEYYHKTFKKSIKATIKENIYGSDILDYNIIRTKLLLSIYALINNEILEDSDFNLYQQDSLKANWKLQFDNIVGNPPYVKFQDLTDDSRKYLINNWDTIQGGSFNLFFAFFELGYNLLKPTGKLGYITPNNYFTSLAGEAVRKYFQQKKCISRIVDFSHKKVFEAQTYTAITFLNKKENESILFDRIKNDQSPQYFLSIANGSPNYLKDLNVKKWRLLKKEEQIVIKTIETIGTPIKQLFDISVGIATLKDEVFFIDGGNELNNCYLKTTANGVFEIEKEITKPVYKISDFKSQNDINTNNRRIICPYNIINGSAIPIVEEEFKVKYPKCYEYLLSEKSTLLARDKGKVNFSPFFIWGRTQGLSKVGKRILNPTFSLNPRFLLVEDEEAFFTNGYGIFFREQQSTDLFSNYTNSLADVSNIDVVQKILNSYLMHYYITKTSVSIDGGYPCYQKNFIENFSIPNFSKTEIELLRNLNSSTEINHFLLNKYHLLNVLSGNLV